MKTKKPSYSPVSPLATAFGLAVTGAASSNPITAPAAAPLGTVATGILGGANLTDGEMTIKDKFDEAINKTWDQIYADYKLTDVCFLRLRQEVIGENTSTDEFVNNSQRKKLEESYALATQTILEKYKGGLEHKSKKAWDDEYIKNASKDIASRLMKTLNSVFEEDDLVKILKAIADRSEDIRGNIAVDRAVDKLEHEHLMQLILELKEDINKKTSYPNVPFSLTTIPPAVNLIGRDKDIQAIRNHLDQHNIISIRADGGVGKTAVAAKIANEIKDEIVSGKSSYRHIVWITSTGSLKTNLTAINIPAVVAAKTLEEKLSALRAFFDSTSTFLVIDNMDYLPSKDENRLLNTIAGKVKILITTRADISISKPYLLSEIDTDSALLLLYRHYKRDKEITINQIKERDDVSFAEQIVEAAGKNALFIELIGKMAYSEKKNLRELWELLKDNVFGKDSAHNIPTDHAESHGEEDGKLLTQIQKLYKLSTISDKQKEIMSFIALFPAEHSIFFDVFKWAGFDDDKEDHLGALQDRGWIDRDEEGYFIHTMVQGSVKLQSGKEKFDEERYENLIDELAGTDQYIPGGMVYTKVRERIVVSDTVCGLLTDNGSEKENTALLYNSIAGVYRAQGNYEKALEYNEKALVIREKVLGSNHPDTATTYNNIAGVYKDQGNYGEAFNFCKKALRIRENVLGTEHSDTAETYNDIAGVYEKQGNYEKALDYLEKALVILEEVLGREHPDTAITYNNLASVYYSQGNYEKALEYYEKSLAIREKVLGKEHPSTATTYNNIALVYAAQSNYEKALEYYEKDRKISEEVLGKEHPNTATTYDNLAGVYCSQGNYEKALEYYEKALAIREKVLGKEHPDTAKTYNNVALLYYSQGNYEKALDYLEKALVINEEALGKEHPDTAATYNNIAHMYYSQGNCEKALEYYEKALVIAEKVLGKEHPDTATTYNNMAVVYYSQGNYENALEYYEKALVIREKVLGKEHPSTAVTYDNMAGVYEEQGNYEKALEYYEKAVKIFDEKLGPEHPNTKIVRGNFEAAKKALTSN